MKYRKLRAGTIIRNGDEWLSTFSHDWNMAKLYVGCRVAGPGMPKVFRRPIKQIAHRTTNGKPRKVAVKRRKNKI